MKVPLLDLSAQLETVREELEKQVLGVIESCQYILGPKVEEIESTIARYSECAYGIGVSSGTDALLVSLMALGIGPGDLVLTSPHSFFATAGVVARLGARPVFVDIDPETYNISPDCLDAWFKKNQAMIPKVKAIVVVHLFGQCAEMERILKCVEPYSIPVIEDAAQSIGATYPSKQGIRKAGSMGILGCLSFFPSKNLGAIGDAGMVVCNSSTIDEKIRLLRTHGAKPKYFHSEIGGNFRMAPIQAAALVAKFPYLAGWHKKRRINAEFYDRVDFLFFSLLCSH